MYRGHPLSVADYLNFVALFYAGSSCAVILACGNIIFSSSSLHFLVQIRNSGLKLPDTLFLSLSCSKVFSRLFRFTILERFLVIVFCSLSLFYPLTFWLRGLTSPLFIPTLSKAHICFSSFKPLCKTPFSSWQNWFFNFLSKHGPHDSSQ